MTDFSRRHFMKACGAAAAVVTGITPAEVRAENSIRYWMHNFDEERFGEETLLRQAMELVSDRFQDRRVWQNAYDQRASRHNLKSGTMERANLQDTEQNRSNLLWYQLDWLSKPNSPHDVEPPFPNVHLHAFHEESKLLGYAKEDSWVVVRCVGTDRQGTPQEVRQAGEFEVYLNRFKLGAGGQDSDPEEWASTIAHEMLHNLGHLHEKGDYSDEWQINVFNNAVLCNGNYRPPRYRWRNAQTPCGQW